MKKWENPLQGLLLPPWMLFQLVKASNALILAIHQIPVNIMQLSQINCVWGVSKVINILLEFAISQLVSCEKTEQMIVP